MRSIKRGVRDTLKAYDIEVTPDVFLSIVQDITTEVDNSNEWIVSEGELCDLVDAELDKRGL